MHSILIRIISIILAALVVAPVLAQEPNQDQIDPASARRAWLKSTPAPFALDLVPPVPPPHYVLTKSERDKFGGTFGIDLSHWEFDIDKSDPIKCKTQAGYTDPDCSCAVDWQAVGDNGIRYVYSKATDAGDSDLSFARFWKDLQPKHDAKVLFRGAFHFLRPGVDPKLQADSFLRAIGAVNGAKPAQLPPMVDLEWSNKVIVPNTPEFNACPVKRRTHDTDDGKDRWLCDMWYTMSGPAIATMAKTWIDRVEQATGRPVIIYTNSNWWRTALGDSGAGLLKSQAVVTSLYLPAGPKFNDAWGNDQNQKKWKMAPLPKGASYPPDKYTIADSWQFTDRGYLPSSVFTCNGKSESRKMDMNWVPVSGDDYLSLFGVK